jgi:phosphonate transport system substrate-binding protein
MISRRLFLAQASLLVASCAARTPRSAGIGRLLIGTVAYGAEGQSVDQYQQFVEYLESQTKTLIELEPAFNEVQAIDQVQRQAWSLVFAPPGLAAIAVSKAQYLPLFPLQGVNNLSSILVVLESSPIQTLNDVNGKALALGQRGSATGYYVPLYELYGTTPSEIRLAPTPKAILEWIASGEVAAGALSKDEFDRYRSEFSDPFRILHTSRRIPSGSVLISPTVDRNQQEVIQKAMNAALPSIAQAAGYVPNVPPPNYETLISFIEKVEPIEARIQEKPAPLYVSGAGN